MVRTKYKKKKEKERKRNKTKTTKNKAPHPKKTNKKTNKKTKKQTKKQKTTKNQHTWFLIFHGPDKELFSPGFPQTKRCKNIEVLQFSTHPHIPTGCGKLPKIKVI